MGIVEQYLRQLNTKKQRFRRATACLTALSLVVILVVSWNLRQTGITLANNASCGYEEHQHTQDCPLEKVLICGFTSEDPTEVPTEEIVSEAFLEPVVETFTEPTPIPTDEPAEEMTEETTETETPTESVLEMVVDAAADILSEMIPVAHAAEIPEEYLQEWEHIHTDACYAITWLCGLEEHLHVLSCYSDVTADLEDWDIWAASVPELTGRISEDIVLVAQSQLGCEESDLNFELAGDGETRNGITRYGQWYGNPYGAWSNMFTSFCLRYAGLTNVPINSGAEKMLLDWNEMNLYRHSGGYEPVAGDIVFLDKNQNGTPESTAVVVRYFDFVLTVIEGDVEDAVVQQDYRIDDPMIAGYGMTDSAGRVMMFAAGDSSAAKTAGETVAYSSSLLNNGGTFILYTTGSDGNYYAIDGNGHAAQIQINNGVIKTDVADVDSLYWKFEKANNYDNKPAFYISNVSTGKHLHPNRDTGTAGALHPDRWETALYASGNGVKFRGARQDAYALLSGSEFTYSQTQDGGSTFYFGKTPSAVTLWLDGTNGNIISCRGSDDTAFTVYSGVEVQLPSNWKSPSKYSYKLAGWVNIKNGDYYLPGDTIVITENTVLYADWVANTYDIGRYNSDVADTVSTNDFVTTYLFDYSPVINLISAKTSESTLSASSHSETWTHVTSNTATYRETLNFSFNDHDSAGAITNPNNRNAENNYTGSINGNNGHEVHQGIYTANLKDTLFGVNSQVVGKHYLGTADHLFQIDTDPNSSFYGYYYYDARLNAASYNQSDERFYVYDYLERASDSASNSSYSDFLPLNSPYANTNGKAVTTYEYNGGTHYSYDSRYDANGNAGSAADHVHANWWYGMRTDIQFALPEDPGTGGNKDIYGNDMHFHFAGDDDVWILIDDQVVLDLGGIHQEAEGDINFSTGVITVKNGSKGTITTNLRDYGIKAGEYTLSILYLERGASMSNCGIYFNLAPRFSLTLRKEDVLTQDVLNKAEFCIYYDQACTQLCDLWTSQEAYKNKENPAESFIIENGKAYIWGLSPSRTYYIKEVSPPNAPGYEPAKGVIKLTLDKNGLNSYSATILEGPEGEISHGFTVHGFRIDEENQAAYISITNAQTWVKHTTSVYVEKKWNDNKDHTYDSVTVYLNVTDSKGTRRIREIQLSRENKWQYTWTNLPMYTQDPNTGQESDQAVQYSVSEAYVPGYSYSIGPVGSGSSAWAEAKEFKNGETYVLNTNRGCLTAVSANSDTLGFVNEATAKESPLALWTATVSNNLLQLTNQVGQSLLFNYGGWQFSASYDNFTILTPDSSGMGVTLASVTQHEHYVETIYICEPYGNGYLGGSGNTLVFHPLVKPSAVANDASGYTITNTPLTSETAVKVIKRWEHPFDDVSAYEKLKVTVKLYSNGVDTGRIETIDLQSDWEAVFMGLPYADADGVPYVYTIMEESGNNDWIPAYGDIKTIPGRTPTYEITLTNHYRWVDAFELPSTGGSGTLIFMLSGLILVLAPLVYGLSLRRRYRKGARR